MNASEQPTQFKTPLVVPAGAGPDYDWSADHVYVKTPGAFTDGAVTIVEDTLKPGFHLARHHHQRMSELFYILEGEVTFVFDDTTTVASVGMIVNVPPNVRHEVRCEQGGRLLTIFTPGGFDEYLASCASLTAEQAADAALQADLAQRYDIWPD